MVVELGAVEPAPFAHHALLEIGMAAAVDRGRFGAHREIAFVGIDRDAFDRDELDPAARDFGPAIEVETGLLAQLAASGCFIAFARIERAAGRAPEGRTIVRGEAEQQYTPVRIGQQDA